MDQPSRLSTRPTDTTGRLFPVCERTRNGERERPEYRLTPRADEDIQAQANTRADRPVNFPRAADTITGPRIISGSRLDPLLAYPSAFTNQRGPSNNRGGEGPPYPVLRLIKSINGTNTCENGVPSMERGREGTKLVVSVADRRWTTGYLGGIPLSM